MRLVLAVVVMLTAISCSSELAKPAAPDDLIPQDTMVLIMHNLVILEGHIEGTYPGVREYHKLMRKTGDKALKGFNVSPQRFERSYEYYVSRQDVLQEIYTEVLDSLNKEVNELKAKGVKSETVRPAGSNLIEPFNH